MRIKKEEKSVADAASTHRRMREDSTRQIQDENQSQEKFTPKSTVQFEYEENLARDLKQTAGETWKKPG